MSLCQKLYRSSGSFNGVVSVAAQLDMDSTGVLLLQGAKDGTEVDFTFAEEQVFVHAMAHVFDVHVPKAVLPFTDMLGNRYLAHAVEMADVEGQSKGRMVDSVR